MLIPIYKNRFAKDLKLLKKRDKNTDKLVYVLNSLVDEKVLDKKFHDLSLKGEYADCRECHIAPDWLFIYMINKPHIIFIGTGTYSDLFK